MGSYPSIESVPAWDILSHLRDGLVLADAEGRIVRANDAAQRLLGSSLEALRGKRLARVVSQLDPPGRLSLHLVQPIDRPGAAPRVWTLETPAGRCLELRCGWISDGGAGRIGCFLVLSDRTERQRNERKRHQTQRLESLGVLAAGIAHEINNPLAFVRANQTHVLQSLSGLAEGGLPSRSRAVLEEVHEALEDSNAGLDRIANIVASVRRLSREAPDQTEPVDLNGVIADALRLAALHENRHVPVETDLDERLPAFAASAERMGQVVLNLLINAKQVLAGRSDGRIRIETHRLERGVEIQVHDNGPGISPDILERIFDPFFTTKDPDEGTGLGLSIAFDIVREYEGVIEAGRSALGGACFTVRFPTSRGPLRTR